jgi:hypothetical protein
MDESILKRRLPPIRKGMSKEDRWKLFAKGCNAPYAKSPYLPSFTHA